MLSDVVIVIHIAQAIAQASSLVLDPVMLFRSQGYGFRIVDTGDWSCMMNVQVWNFKSRLWVLNQKSGL